MDSLVKTYWLRISSIRLFWTFLIICMVCVLPSPAQQPDWRKNITGYLATLLKPGGGYGWADQPDAHLTPTFAVLGILDAIGMIDTASTGSEMNKKLQTIVSNLHPQTGINREGGNSGTEMRDLVYQQIQSLAWIGGDASHFRPLVRKWASQKNKVANFETHGHPVFMQELMKAFCFELLAMPFDSVRSEVLNLLVSRRRTNGSFNNAPAAEGGDGNLLNSFFGIKALLLCEKDSVTMIPATTAWIKKCQLDNGAFTHQPDATIGASQDVIYTWAAVSGLTIIKQAVPRRQEVINYLLSLQNDDGGFGKTPGQPSDPVAAYYAVSTLKKMGALEQLATVTRSKSDARSSKNVASELNRSSSKYSNYHIYSVQFEAPGVGSTEEAVMLAKDLKIDLWGTKNENASWVGQAEKAAKEQGASVQFFTSGEPYGKNVHVAGMGTFNHILDYIAPLNSNIHFADSPGWKSFREETVRPLLDANGALIWQVSNNEPLARMLLDETLQRGGYAAISTIHFSQNFLFWLPFLYQYRYQLPFIALQDAHGAEAWWWANELCGYRNLYLAKKPGYEGLMEALKNNLVVAVRHDSVSSFQNRMLGGAPDLQEHMRKRIKEWRWWTNDSDERGRPWAVISVLKTDDAGVHSRPAAGTNIRVRTWWNTNLQYLLNPVVKLDKFYLDGKEIPTAYNEIKDNKGQQTDAVYLAHMPQLSKGKHVVRIIVKNLRTNRMKTIEKTFII